MPTLSSMQIPPPTDWVEFESIVLSAMAIRWTSPDLQKNGRSGQGQQGVDISGVNDLGQLVGIQCKKSKDKLKEAEVDKEIANATHFKPAITTLYIATTQPLDAPLQAKVRLKSAARVSAGDFAVQILFWEDIIQNLVTNPRVFATHYPTLAGTEFKKILGLRLFALFDLVFYGKTLDHQADVIFGEYGVMTGVDPDNIFRLCTLIRTSATQVLSSTDQQKIEQELVRYEQVINEILALGRAFATAQDAGEKASSTDERRHQAEIRSKWDQSRVYAERIASYLDGIRSSLALPGLAVFELGASLANWARFEFNSTTLAPIAPQQLNNVTGLIGKVAPKVLQQVNERIEKYNTDQLARANTAEVIFEIIHAELVMEEILGISN